MYFNEKVFNLTISILYYTIGEELTSRKASEFHKLNAFRKFSLLWHVGRELAANSQNVGDMFYK